MTFSTTAAFLLAWLGTDPGLLPAPFPARERSGALEIARSVELRPLQPQELVRGPASRSLGTPAASLVPVPLRIERELPMVWEMWLPKDWRPERLEVDYEVVSADGQHDRLAHRGRADSTIGLHLVALPPEVVSEIDDRILVRGSLLVEIDVESLRFAGTYEGTLNVTVRER